MSIPQANVLLEWRATAIVLPPINHIAPIYRANDIIKSMQPLICFTIVMLIGEYRMIYDRNNHEGRTLFVIWYISHINRGSALENPMVQP